MNKNAGYTINKKPYNENEIKLYTKKLSNVIHFYNYSKEEIPFNNFEYWDSAFYIYFCGSQEDAKVIDKIWKNYQDDDSPINASHFNKGLYFYKDMRSGWIYIAKD